MDSFTLVSEKIVVRDDESGGFGKYFTKIDSSECIESVFPNEDAEYNVSHSNVRVNINSENAEFTNGVLMTFSEDRSGGCRFFDVLMTNGFGCYVSGFY